MIDTTPILKMLGYGAIFILIFGIFIIWLEYFITKKVKEFKKNRKRKNKK